MARGIVGMITIKKCALCGKEFEAKTPQTKYCCYECKHYAQHMARLARYKEEWQRKHWWIK
jgi:DNA-directed RNA polymerase subunit RPC12/RpoP